MAGCALFSRDSKTDSQSREATRVDPSLLVSGEAGKLHPIQPGSTALLGSGFNSFKNEVLGHCVENGKTETIDATPLGRSQKAELEVSYAADVEQLGKSLGVSGHAQARFGFGKVSVEAAYANSEEFSSRSSFLVARGSTFNATEVLSEYRLRDAALALLRDNPPAFFRQCGDQFVAARVPGAMFHAIAEIRDTSTATRISLKAKASYSYLFASVGAGVETEATSALKQHALRFRVIQRGLQQSIPADMQEFVETARSLNERINSQEGGATAIAFVTAPFDLVTNWPADVTIPSLVRQERTLETLATWHRTLSLELSDLKLAYDEPRDRPCTQRDKRFDIAFGNLEASIRRLEERAHACLDEPMKNCNVSALPAPHNGGYASLVGQCSDRAAALQRRQADDASRVARKRRNAVKKRRRAKNKNRAQAACKGSGRPDCAPCMTWSFDRLGYDAPARKGNGYCWDWPGCGRPDPLLEIRTSEGAERSVSRKDTKHVDWNMTKPLVVDRSVEVSIDVRDIDASSHDSMSSFNERVPAQLTDGTWVIGGGSLTLTGTCVR